MDYKSLLDATNRFEKLSQMKAVQPFSNAVIADALTAAKLVRYADEAKQEPTLANPYFGVLKGVNDRFYKLIEKYNILAKKSQTNPTPELDKQIRALENEINSMVGQYGITVIANSNGQVNVMVGNLKYFSRKPEVQKAMGALVGKIQSVVSNYIKQREFSTRGKASLVLLPTFTLDW